MKQFSKRQAKRNLYIANLKAMLTALLIFYLKKLNQKHSLFEKLMKIRFSLILKGLSIFLICMIIPGEIYAQTKKMVFEIRKNNTAIGRIKVEQNTLNLTTCYHLNSEIKVSMFINLTIVSTEKTVFENGRLSYSSVQRKVNNREKVNKRVEFLNGIYKLYNGKTCNSIRLDSTSTNLASLYLNEPVYSKAVFCDNHQSVSSIIKMEVPAIKSFSLTEIITYFITKMALVLKWKYLTPFIVCK